MPPMQYKSFTLDAFQEEAVQAIESNHSVLVSAPTGSGKTLIADYIIDRDIKQGKCVIYTGPIKALSNQKYRDFCREYGHENVGILTGDVVINPNGTILVMTTEVYRNMVLVNDPLIENVSYVIFDEVHFISDPDRGYIWEESIIFSPKHIRMVFLSATIPNADQFAKWVELIKGHQVIIVRHETRPVPLASLFFDVDRGITTLPEIRKQMDLDRIPHYDQFKKKHRNKGAFIRAPSHLELIEDLKTDNLVPTIYFTFSRASTVEKAKHLAEKHDFLSPDERHRVVSFVQDQLDSADEQIKRFESTQFLRRVLGKGIGVHHAGLLPKLKDIVEQLFGMGLIKVLYATETFAVGINMPAKVVCFDSLEKYDGRNFRYLNSKEYFQLAGRAGRRGIDKEGKAIAMVNRRFFDLKRVHDITTRDIEPLKSQFRLSVNTILNMVHRHQPGQIDVILRSSFEFYQKYGPRAFHEKRNPYKESFERKRKQLEKMGYVQGYTLTEKGKFAAEIFFEELLITEIFFEQFWKQFDDVQTLVLLAILLYEPKRSDKFEASREPLHGLKPLRQAVSDHPLFKKKIHLDRIDKLAPLIFEWYKTANLPQLLEMTNLLEGDIIRLFRQIIDMSTQIKQAAQTHELKDRMENVIGILNRGLIEVEF
ncbi:DEAD/DEAH box helicase [Candidatus Woesearchaeota archaeon]|nr:DEAD/DEAH box helicase [Candidatus Woesearchaeota archaeon]